MLTNDDIARLWEILDTHGRENGDIEYFAQDAFAGGMNGARAVVSKIGADMAFRLVESGHIPPDVVRDHAASIATGFLVGATLADMGYKERTHASSDPKE